MKAFLLYAALMAAAAALCLYILVGVKKTTTNDTHPSKWDYPVLEDPSRWALLDGKPEVMIYNIKTGEVGILIDSLIAKDSSSAISIQGVGKTRWIYVAK